MKVFIIAFLSIVNIYTVTAQEAKFTVEVSSDSILMGNYFKVTFSIENANPRKFDAPLFQDFNLVGGPNQSSSMSMINGVTTQSQSYAYYLEPKEEGVFYIEPASIELNDKFMETEPIKIRVAPNPDGIIQSPNQQKNRTFDSFFDRPFFNEPKAPKKPKKKRKYYKI